MTLKRHALDDVTHLMTSRMTSHLKFPLSSGETPEQLDDDVATGDDANTGSSASQIISVYPLELQMEKSKAHLRIKVCLHFDF